MGHPGPGHCSEVSHRARGGMGWRQWPPCQGTGVRDKKYKREKAKDERARTQERETEHKSEEEERGDVSAQENRIREGERESG